MEPNQEMRRGHGNRSGRANGEARALAAGSPTDARTFILALDRSTRRPLYRQLYEGLRRAILEGRLRPGARVPSTRWLAAELGVGRNTVLLAFDLLTAEGYLVGRRGAGTRVNPELPPELVAGWRERADAAQGVTRQPRLAGRCAKLVGMPRALPSLSGRGGAFTVSLPALEAFPTALWARLARRAALQLERRAREGFDPAGYGPLREAIAAYVGAARGVVCSAAQVVVVQGTQQALDLLSRTLLDGGDAVCIEDPGYPGVWGPLAAAQARVIPVPVDEHGLRVAEVEREKATVRAIYVSPSHQFPLGSRMSLERRLALLDIAERRDCWIVEDDYDSEFRYDGPPITALRGLDRSDRVIYVGSFSKTILPSLRVGFLVLPRALVEPFLAVRVRSDLHPPLLSQLLLTDFLSEGHFARHVRRMRMLYGRRRDCLLEAGRRELTGLLELAPDDTGLRLVGYLPDGVDDGAAVLHAAAQGVEVLPLSRFYRRGSPRSGLILGFAGTNEANIRAGVKRLRAALAGPA